VDVRPEPPDDDDTPQLSDAVWKLAEICWVKDPKRRPTASAVCDTIRIHYLSVMGRGCLCLAYTYGNPRIWAFERHMEGTLAMIFKSNNTEFCAVSPDGKWIAARN